MQATVKTLLVLYTVDKCKQQVLAKKEKRKKDNVKQ